VTFVNIQEHFPSVPWIAWMYLLYCPPPLTSGYITHPCNSGYLGKIFLYIDHNHMEYLYNIWLLSSLWIYQNFEYIDCDIWFIELVGLAKHHHFNAHIWKSPSPITLLIDKCKLEESTWRIKIRSLSLE